MSSTAARLRSHALLPHLSLLAVTLIWGATFALVKAALREVSPLLFNLLRMALAAAVLLAVNANVLRGLSRAELRLGAGAGVLLALGYQFQTTGLVYTTAPKSAFLTGLVVVLVPLLSLLPGAAAPGLPRPGPRAFAGAALALVGVVLLTSPRGSGRALLAGIGVGEWLTLVCALCFAGHLLFLAHAARRIAARRLGTLQIVFAALTMLLTLPLGGRPVLHWTGTVVLALAVTAVLATALAFTVQSWAQGRIAASHAALIFTMEPVFAWLTSIVFLGETLARRSMLGAGFILGGILVSELGPTSPPGPGVLAAVEE